MTKKLKAAIFAAAFISLGGAAYTYNQYGTQDNSMTLANVEALTGNNEESTSECVGGESTYNPWGHNYYAIKNYNGLCFGYVNGVRLAGCPPVCIYTDDYDSSCNIYDCLF